MPFKTRNLVVSFRYAFAGLWFALRRERNIRIHGIVGTLTVILAVHLGVTRLELAVILLTIGLVLTAEMVNTALETVVDLFTDEYHPLAALSKNLAAGAVLVTAISAVPVGILVMGKYLVIAQGRAVPLKLRSGLLVAIVGAVFVVLLVVAIKAALGNLRGFRGGMPSGHSALAAALVTAIYFVGASPTVVALAIGLALLVAQSRLEARIHSLTEVLIGMIVGIGMAWLVFSLLAV